MVNRNGSNNGTHEAAAVAARNGNGHKPDAAIPGEHELLWDGLPPSVIEKLSQPLDSALVSQRKGRGGKSFDYLEGHAVIDQANRVFGFGGWGYELLGDVTLRRVETVDARTGEVKTEVGYSAPVRVTVAGAPPRTDLGVHPVTEENFDGHDTAMKGAVTDGLKRAFRSFGCQFGNSFYGDQPAASAPQPQRVPVQANRNGNSGSSQVGRPTRQAQPKGGDDAQVEKLRKRLFGIASEMGLGRRQGARRRRQEVGQEPRRPDGRRARAAGGGRRQQAAADAAGPGGSGRLAGPVKRRNGAGFVSLSGAAPLSHYRTDQGGLK